MIFEAMSAGTPVIAVGEMAQCLKSSSDGAGRLDRRFDGRRHKCGTSKLDELSRRDVRNHFLSSFTAERIARDMRGAYARLLGEQLVENGAKSEHTACRSRLSFTHGRVLESASRRDERRTPEYKLQRSKGGRMKAHLTSAAATCA